MLSGCAGGRFLKKRAYRTSFAATEAPISEGGIWINGAAVGLSWQDMRMTPGLAYGPANFLSNTYDDATAVLSGAWHPDRKSVV